MCAVHFRSFETVTPRSFAEETILRSSSINLYYLLELCLFLVILRFTHVDGGKKISLSVDQFCKLFRSCWTSRKSLLLLMILKYLELQVLITSGKSLMYIRNRVGPNRDPWGTPDSTTFQLEEEPFRTTCCIRPVR